MLSFDIVNTLIPEKFVSFDLETTGLDPNREDIIEIAAVVFVGGNAVDAFDSLVLTDKEISPYIASLTGITTAEMRSGGRPLKEVVSQFLEFIGESPIVAHNAKFDVTFLNNKLKLLKKDLLKNTVYDSLMLSRLGLPGLDSYKLEALGDRFSLHEGKSHRAGADALLCGKVFIKALSGVHALPEKKRRLIGKLLAAQESPVAGLLKPLLPTVVSEDKPKEPPQPLLPLSESKELSAIPKTAIDELFATNGKIAKSMEEYEAREGQIEMAQLVRRALNDRELLVVEAGTGTGKSLAYLAAALLYSVKNCARVIISTRTKTLQDQIYKKEVPFLRNITGLDFRATLLKGRSNYLCVRKWKEVVNASALFLRNAEADVLLPLVPWIEETGSGDISECTVFNERENRILWARIASDSETCRGSRCYSFNECFVMRKRREALASNLVFINHSLFFTDLRGDRAILGDYSRIVFDEAHALEEVGRKHLGEEVSHVMFSTVIQKLYKKDGEGVGGRGILRYLAVLLAKSNRESLSTLAPLTDDLCMQAGEMELRSVYFFRKLGGALKKTKKSDKLRYKESLFTVIGMPRESMGLDGYLSALKTLRQAISDAVETEEEIKEALQDFAAMVRELDSLNSLLRWILEGEGEGMVFWAEGHTNPLNIKLVAVPLEIREKLADSFLPKITTAVFTSATLAIKESLDYFKRRVGLDGTEKFRVAESVIPSHYNYNSQLLLALNRGIELPDTALYSLSIADILVSIALTMKKRTLVLFTSKEMLRQTYEKALSGCENAGVRLFAQDINGNTWHLLEEMRKNPGAILLGTDTFWEGVDLPGDYLELLIIARLPFGVPTDPIVEARSEAAEAANENSFTTFYLPEAVIKFRQGVGRLIRRHDDRGAALILDRRIWEKPYGKVFLGSINGKTNSYADASQMISGVSDWFNGVL